jgi:hypothetical protein
VSSDNQAEGFRESTIKSRHVIMRDRPFRMMMAFPDQSPSLMFHNVSQRPRIHALSHINIPLFLPFPQKLSPLNSFYTARAVFAVALISHLKQSASSQA